MTSTLVPPPAPPTAPPTVASSPVTAPRVAGPGLVTPTIATGVAVMLATLSLWPLFHDAGWLGAVIAVVVAVVCAGGIATWLRAPLFLVPIIQAGVLFSALVALFTDDAPLGFVPSPDAMSGLRTVFADGMSAIDTFAPPVPVSDGVTAVVALGVGCVALTVFVLQVSLRVPTAAGVPLIALYVVPALVLDDGAPWWTFVLVAAAWLLLLVTDERMTLAGWGRMLRRAERGTPTSALSGLSSAGIRLGSAAVLLALVLPVLVPGLADAVLGRSATSGSGSGTDGDGTGTAGSVTVDPLVSLNRNLRLGTPVTMLHYQTKDTSPSYLRLVVLENFDGTAWRPTTFAPSAATPVGDGEVPLDLPSTPGVSAVPHTYDVTADALAQSFLPVPEGTTSLRSTQPWFVDNTTGTIFGTGGTRTSRNDSWSAGALKISPTPAQLDAAPDFPPQVQAELQRGGSVPPVLATQAAALTTNATSRYRAAVAIQQWFLDNFEYSTAESIPTTQSVSALEQFLTDKKGYCQQFAASMALMARAIGIPSRVVVGFTQGSRDSTDPTTWTVSSRDTHAWPELEFQGIGWVRFEPTPRGGPVDGHLTVPTYATVSALPPTTAPGTNATRPPNGHGSNLREDAPATDADLGEATATTASTSAETWRLRGLALLAVALVVALLVPMTWRWLRRRRRLAGSVEDAWAELRDSARDLGVGWSDAQTPRQAATTVIARQSLVGEAAEATRRLARATEQVRYAPTPSDPGDLAHDVGTVRAALWRRAENGARLRAVLWPASLRRTVV